MNLSVSIRVNLWLISPERKNVSLVSRLLGNDSGGDVLAF
jgi:hypothetical protein